MAASTSLFIHSTAPSHTQPRLSLLFLPLQRAQLRKLFHIFFFPSSRPFSSHSFKSFVRKFFAAHHMLHMHNAIGCLISSKTNSNGTLSTCSVHSPRNHLRIANRCEAIRVDKKEKKKQQIEAKQRRNMFAFSCALCNVASPATRTHSLFRFPKLFIVSFIALETYTPRFRLRFILHPQSRASDANSMVVVFCGHILSWLLCSTTTLLFPCLISYSTVNNGFLQDNISHRFQRLRRRHRHTMNRTNVSVFFLFFLITLDSIHPFPRKRKIFILI